MTTNYKIGDPVVDLAQGRAMTILNTPDITVREWSDANDYNLTENYANAKLGADPTEGVVECAYVADIRSEPSKSYTFPESRVCLIDAHHADEGRRVYDRVAVEVLTDLFNACHELDSTPDEDGMYRAAYAVFDSDVASEASELADVAQRFGDGDA